MAQLAPEPITRAQRVEELQALGCSERGATSAVELLDVVVSTLKRRLPLELELWSFYIELAMREDA